MIIDASSKLSRGKKKEISKWREAANDAIAKIARLQKAVKFYVEMDEKGEPWPGKQQERPLNKNSANT